MSRAGYLLLTIVRIHVLYSAEADGIAAWQQRQGSCTMSLQLEHQCAKLMQRWLLTRPEIQWFELHLRSQLAFRTLSK